MEWKKLLRGSLHGSLESHPGKKLVDHLCGTAALAQALVRFHGFDDVESDVAHAAYTHDLGKSTLDFQRYLHGRGNSVSHALPSSFFTVFTSSEKGKSLSFERFFSTEVVRRHHSRLEDWEAISTFCSRPSHTAAKLVPESNHTSRMSSSLVQCFPPQDGQERPAGTTSSTAASNQ